MTFSWLAPALAYVVVLGAVGVTSKLALRTMSWQEMLLWTAVLYAIAAVAVMLTGKAGFHWETNTWWALVSALCVVSALVFFYLALGAGEASKVVPVTAAYPAVTFVLSVMVLSEHISAVKVGGLLLVMGGVVVLTISN